ncbi:tetratricopeptide repeat protein [Amorphus sp. 3PC139-8]|uniref:tetratricopeptide repeat protein n=1 Tax=Amorphus sp. 3PC139-8 TaxID=2735676 RepID=UPI00345D1AA0
MTDIFQEVEEDIRRERLKSLWDRFGIAVILIAVLIVAVTAGYKGYQYFKERSERAAGDTFLTALDQAADGNSEQAAEALTAFAADAPGGYPVLARFRAASEQALAGNMDASIGGFDTLAADTNLSARQRDLARVRAGYVLLNGGERSEIQKRLTPVASVGGPWQDAAREVLGLAAYQDGDLATARKWFSEISNDAGATQDLRSRVQLMSELIAAEMSPPAASDDDTGPETGGAAASATKVGE